MKMIFVLAAVMTLTSACSTVKTINPEEGMIDITRKGRKSHCKEIPRVYSGSFYVACLAHSEPSEKVNLGGGINGVPAVVLDGVFSFVADTVVLPYTIYKQSTEGNISAVQ